MTVEAIKLRKLWKLWKILSHLVIMLSKLFSAFFFVLKEEKKTNLILLLIPSSKKKISNKIQVNNLFSNNYKIFKFKNENLH